ncbi:type IV toxin-antitoxin system AbiEi family antitoxin [Planctomycetota bacterium]
MTAPTEQQAAQVIVDLLGELFDCSTADVQLRSTTGAKRYDFAISTPSRRFVAEYKSNASTAAIADAVEMFAATKSNETPIVIVPYMGEVGQRLCDQARISWMDLSGNAKIVANDLKIWIKGRPNKFVQRGRPANVFAPKSSRIARQLLLVPNVYQSQADLARKTELGDGYISKIVRRLRDQRFLEQDEQGAVRPRTPDVLLDAWRQVYDFDRHRIIKGHVSERTGEGLLAKVTTTLKRKKAEYHLTGLGAAWLYTEFANFRLVTIYLKSMPTRSLLTELEFAEEERGANLWLVVPNDDGVFHGSRDENKIKCVHPVQAYLDLKAHPERARDAAKELRQRQLDWQRDE